MVCSFCVAAGSIESDPAGMMMMQGYDWEENAGWMMDDACFGVKMLAAQLNAGAPVHGKPWRGLSPASAWWSGLVLVSLGGPATGGWRGAVGLAVAPVCSARHHGHGMCARSDSLLAHRAACFGAAARIGICMWGWLRANHSPFTNASSIYLEYI